MFMKNKFKSAGIFFLVSLNLNVEIKSRKIL